LRARRIGIAAVVEADGVWLDLDCRIVVGDGALLLAGVEIGEPAVVQRRGVGRIELDRLVVVGDGFVVFGRRGVSDAAVVVDGGLLRVVLDRLVVIGDRLGEFALGLPLDATVGIRQRQRAAVVGAGLDGARAGRDRVVARALGAGFPVVGEHRLSECRGDQQRGKTQSVPSIHRHSVPLGLRAINKSGGRGVPTRFGS